MKYSEQEKLKIIEEAKDSGNIVNVAQKYSISDASIHYWIKKFGKTKKKKDMNIENKKLKKQLGDSKLENSILKDLLKKTVQVWDAEDKLHLNTSSKELLKQKH